MDRRSFILALGHAGVDAIQVSAQELKTEVESELGRVVNASPIFDGPTESRWPAPGPSRWRRTGFNVTSFTPVRTEALRLEAQLQPEMSGGVLNWRVP